MAANLAQPREGGQHVNLALVEALLGHGLHHLLAAAAQFGQVELALLVAQLAVAALLDAVGQILGHVLLEPAQQQRAQLGREPPAGDALGRFGVLAARLVGLGELLLVAEVAGLDEIDDAPQVEQAVLQRRAGQRQAVLGLQLLDRLRHLRAGVLDELRLVQNHRAEGELLQLLQVAPQQGVVGDDDIVLRESACAGCAARRRFPAPAPSGAGVKRLASRRQLCSTEAGQITSDGFGSLPCRSLSHASQASVCKRLAQAHVVGQDAAQPDAGQVAEEIEAVLLIRPHLRLHRRGQLRWRERPRSS